MPPSVSVALCTYNGAEFIEQQLLSILRQSMLPDEIVISDDGSTDETLRIVESVWSAHRKPNVTLTLLANDRALGVSRNFEQAVSACTGELIALSDQDDVWREDRLVVMTDQFVKNPHLRLLFTDAQLVDADLHPLQHSLFEALEISQHELSSIREGGAFATLLRRNLVTGATVVFRQDLLAQARPFAEGWVHDEWLAAIAAATGEIDWLPQQLVDYRQHGTNQIGVTAPTLRYKVKRVLEPRGDRNQRLAERSVELVRRLVALGVPDSAVTLAEHKSEFEAARAALPAARLARVARIVRLARAGEYAQFASKGNADILRDLLQPVR